MAADMDAEHVDQVKFIGDTHTMLYRAAGTDPVNLPAEERRIYFASEDEAQAAGYRPNHGEMDEHEHGAAH
jgi:hypothetical protein